MRTTITLEPDVEHLLKRTITDKKISLKRAVNDALRIGLSARNRRKEKPFRVKPHACGFKPGIDIYKLGQLADELEAEETLKKLLR
jgi:hypothetical protein